MRKGLLNVILMILEHMLHTVSPDLRELFQNFLKSLYAKAKQTSNPFDDIFVVLLAELVGISEEELKGQK